MDQQKGSEVVGVIGSLVRSAFLSGLLGSGLLGALVSAAALPCVAAGTSVPAAGAIYLTTLPSGADAWIDGTYVGRTPTLVDALAPGKHTITTAKTGWENRTVEVTVGDKIPFQFVDFQLDRSVRAPRGTGRLAIHAPVPVEGVTIDGVEAKLGPGGSLDVPPGPHDLSIRTARGRVDRHVQIYAEMTTNVLLPAAGDDGEDRASVIAPAAQYLPPGDFAVDGRRLTIRHNGHSVTGLVGETTLRVDGASTAFDSAPTFIDGKLYLPLDLFVRIGAVPLQTR